MALLWLQLPRWRWAQPATVRAGTTGEVAAVPLFARSSFAHPATMMAGTTFHGAGLASGVSVGVGSASDCGGGHDR
jgi:hypothetical protein